MSTLASPNGAPARGSRRARFRLAPPLPLAVAVAVSRLVVLAGAVAGATLTHRAADWQLADPLRLTLRLGSLGNVLAAAGDRWDAVHYLAIAQHGYNTPSNTVFFPLYPLLIHAAAWVTRSDVIGATLISAVAYAVSLVLLHRLTREELGDRAADATVLLLAFSPLALFFTAIYTESLFLALSLGSFLLARRCRFGWAGAAAAAATLTHVEGVLLIVPLAMMWAQGRHRPAPRERPTARWLQGATGALPLLMPLVPLAGFLVFLHSQGYGWLAPSSDESYYNHHFAGPVIGIVQGASAGFSGLWRIISGVVSGSPGSPISRQDAFENVLYMIVLAICVAGLRLAWRRLPKPYTVYCTLFLATCVSSPVTAVPLTSLDRYVLVLFPLWMVVGQWLAERRLLRPALAASAMLLFVFSLQFARWAFIG